MIKLRWVFTGGFVLLLLFAGLDFQTGLPTRIWPPQVVSGPYIFGAFGASFLAAVALNALWIGAIGEWRAAVIGAVTLCIISAGIAGYLWQQSSALDRLSDNCMCTAPGDYGIFYWASAIEFALFALYCLGFALWSRRFPIKDTRLTPRPVKISFSIFAIVLLVVSITLLMRVPLVFPWAFNFDASLIPDPSVMRGWIYLGVAVSFAYTVTHPRWHNSKGQLLGLLIYDVFQIVPFLAHIAEVTLDHLPGVIIYVAVLVYSGGLAIYYLFVNESTRNWSVKRPEPTEGFT